MVISVQLCCKVCLVSLEPSALDINPQVLLQWFHSSNFNQAKCLLLFQDSVYKWGVYHSENI